MKIFTPNRSLVRNFIFNLSLVFVLLLSVGKGWGQVSVTASGGTASATYSTLKGAFDAVNAGTHSGIISLSITASITETASAVLNASGSGSASYTSINISPSGGAWTVSGAITAGSPLIDFNGADNVTIDGLNTGGNSLTISNTTASSTAGTSTLRFIADASNNLIQNCNILGVSTGAVGTTLSTGTILFGSGTSTGNDNNQILNCNIGDGATLPSMAISSVGTSTTVSNDNITVTGNNIFNWFLAGGANAINLANSSAWTISSNKFYQTASRSGATTYQKVIFISNTSGTGFNINNNIIGFASSSGTGMMTYAAGTAARFTAIDINIGASPVSNIQGNTINNINFSTTSGASTLGAAAFNGIVVNAGGVNIGNVTANTIGASTGTATTTSNIYLQGPNSAGYFPIYVTSATNCIISNNIIGAINIVPTTAAATIAFTGISVAGTGSHTITNNQVGNSTASNITLGVIGTTTSASTFKGIESTATGAVLIGAIGAGNVIQNINLNPVATNVFIGIINSGVVSTLNINYNTIKGIIFGATSTTHASTFTGISNTGACTTSININNNNLGVSGTNLVEYKLTATAASGVLIGITNSAAGSTSAVSIQNNDIRGILYAYTGSGAHTYIIQSSTPLNETISGNTLTNLNVATTGTIYFINNNYTAPANGSKTIQNNSVVTSFTRNASGSSGSFYGYYDNGSSPSTVTHTISGNNFSNVNTGTSSSSLYYYYGISSTDYSSSNPSLIVFSNTINNWSIGAGTGSFIGISLGGFGGTQASPNLVYGNSISNCTSSGTATSQCGLIIGSVSQYVNVYNNTINGNAINGAAAQFIGLNVAGSSNNNKFYNNSITNLTSNTTANLQGIYVAGGSIIDVYQNSINTFSTQGNILGINVIGGTNINVYQQYNNGTNNYSIYGLSSTGASSTIEGIRISGGTTVSVYQNEIYNLSGAGASSPTINGITISASSTANVYRNKIHSLSQSGTISTTSPVINGVLLSGGTTVNTYNNLIGGLTAPSATSTDAIRGISITSTTTSSSNNVYNNTVYITGAGGTNFGTSGIYHAASATSTTAALNLQNNMIFNTCTPSGTGIVTAYRRSAAATFGNYSTSSNKNLFYAGTPSAANTIMSDGTNNYQTMSSFQTAVSTREVNSFTESSFDPATYFVSTTGSNANFLQPANGLNTQAESGGNTIAMCSPDYNGVTRPANNGTGYDLGAWEFAGVSPAPVYTNLSPSPALTSQCNATSRVINIDITTSSGTITGATLNYSHNGIAQTAITMTNSSGNTWTGTMNAPSTVNATVTWSITATNSLGISTSYSGTSFSDAPNTGATATATASPSTVCDGSNTSLNLSIIKNGTGVIGSGAVSSSSSPTPFSGAYGGMKGQYIILASELISAGYSSGNITGLGINFTSSVAATYTDLTIQIGNTSLNAFNSTLNLETGLTTVYGPTSLVNPIAGVNNFTLSTPFNWDGVSNIIISTSWSNNTTTSTSASIITTTTTSNLAQVHKRDSYTPASLLALAGAQSGGASTVGTARPNFTIVGNKLQTASSYSWSNGTSNIGSTNPLSATVTSGTTFTGTATLNGCPMTASVTPTVNPLPTAPSATNSTQCGSGIPTASVSDNNGYSTPTFKWYNASTGGTLLQTNTSTTYLTSINTTTTFYVAVVNQSTGCESVRTAVTATVNQPDAISASTSASTICLGQSVILTAANTASSPTQNYTYSWVCATAGSGATPAISSNPASITPSSAGSFTYTVTGSDGGCNVSNTVTVNVNPVSVAGTAAALNNAICQSAGTTINLTGSTGTIQWQSSSDNLSFSNINGQTSTSLNTGNLSNTIYYKAIITSGVCNSATSNTVTITINNPQVITTTAGSICSTLGSVALSGTSSAGSTLNWYANSTGGASLAAASSFNTPNISSNTNFYVASEQLIGSSSNVGPANYSIGTSATNNSNTAYLVFSVLNTSTRLLSVDIFPSASVGSAFAISIQNSSGTEIFNTGQLQTTVASGQVQTVPIGFDLAVGTGYRILCSTNPTLYRNSAGYTYPYTNGNISITGANNSNYHFFYNWSFVSANQYCSSSRSTVLATVSTPPSITTSASAPTICSGSTTTLNATSSTNSGYSYLWSNGLGAGASVTASPTSTTTYSVTATDNSGGAYNGCTTTATLPITVNPVPSAILLTPSATQNLCLGNIQNIVVSGGLFNGLVNVGTSTSVNSSTGYPAPYTNYYGGAKHQMLIRASELTALGLVNGSQISTVGFNVTSVGSSFTGSLSNFRIDMGHTASNVLGSSSFISGLTNVLPAGTVSIPTTGLPTTKTHTLTTPFTWNGTDNLVIQTSYSNVNSGTTTDFVTMTQSDPGFVSTNWYRADGETASVVLSSTTPTSSGNARPNIILGATIPQPVTFSPTTDLYTNAGATTAYTGNPSTVYSKPTANRTYTATATTAAGCSTTASVTINVAAPTTETVASTDYIWKGTTSTAWGTTTNWTQFDGTNYTAPSAAPTSTSVVVIPQNNTCVQNQPLIGSSAISVQDLKIESGATTTLNSGAQLTISGTLTNNGNLTLESGATIVQGSGSTLAGSGTYNVKQAITGDGTTTPSGRFWYLGSPVSLASSSVYFASNAANVVKKRSESTNAWTALSSGSPEPLLVGQGYYTQAIPANSTINFTGGLLNNGAISITNLTRTAGQGFEGFNLVSNPYPSYLNWDVVSRTNVDGTMWYRTHDGTNMVFETYVAGAAGGVGTNLSGNTATKYIPPMQSYWVRVTQGQTSGSLALDNTMRTHFASLGSSTAGLRSTQDDPSLFLRMNLLQANKKDQLIVYVNEQATNGFDMLDGEKMMQAGYPQFYTKAGDKKIVINGLNSAKKQQALPVTIELPTTGVHSFVIEDLEISNGLVWLEDKQEEIIQALEPGTVYQFYANAGMNAERFVLHFQLIDDAVPTNVYNEVNSSANFSGKGANVYAESAGVVVIKLPASAEGVTDIQIRDAAGKLVYAGSMNNLETSVELAQANGIYYVTLSSNTGVEVRKVFIQQ